MRTPGILLLGYVFGQRKMPTSCVVISMTDPPLTKSLDPLARGVRQILGKWSLTPHKAPTTVGDALVASRPREHRRWRPDTGDHKGRPYETVIPAAARVTKDLSYTRWPAITCIDVPIPALCSTVAIRAAAGSGDPGPVVRARAADRHGAEPGRGGYVPGRDTEGGPLEVARDAGLLRTCPGASGGRWLWLRAPEEKAKEARNLLRRPKRR